jgi:ferredoxin-NADP reductase
MAIQTHTFTVQDSRLVSPRVKHIALQGPITEFIPGQFITVHFNRNGQDYRRSYSIASIPGRDHTIDFAASYVEHGPGSEYLFALQTGDSVQVSGPFGRLILKQEPVKRLFLLATGTGITPYRAMLPALSEAIAQLDIKVCIAQGVQFRADTLYSEDFLAWSQQHPHNAEYRTYLSREDLSHTKAAHEYSGYVQQSLAHTTVDGDIIYLCGNPLMIDAAFAQLQAAGFASSQIRREKYISSK